MNVSRFFCQHCRQNTHFVPICKAINITGVSRSTIYYWIDRSWVHWRELPSGRRVLCQDSLSRAGKSTPPQDARPLSYMSDTAA